MTQITPINNFNIPKQSLFPKKINDVKQEQKQTVENKLYHTKTHAGLLFTGILSSAAIIGAVLCNRMKPEMLAGWGFDNKAVIGMGVFSTALGALTDFFINKTNKKFVEKNKDKTVEELFLTEKKAEPTKKQNIYYETNTGKKAKAAIGAVTGALYLPIMLPLIYGRKSVGGPGVTTALKSIFNKEDLKFTLLITLGASLIGTVSGFIDGAIIDKFANIGARRKVDKMAEKANNATA